MLFLCESGDPKIPRYFYIGRKDRSRRTVNSCSGSNNVCLKLGIRNYFFIRQAILLWQAGKKIHTHGDTNNIIRKI